MSDPAHPRERSSRAALRRAFEFFSRYDMESTVKAAGTVYGRKSPEEGRLSWELVHRLSFFEYEVLAYRLHRIGSLGGLVREVPLIPERALNLARSLEEAGLVKIGSGGEVEFRVNPFGRTAPDPGALGLVPEIDVNYEFDQLQVSKESLFERIAEIASDVPLDGKSVAVMGDDDFQSVVLAASFDVSVTVFELDERVIRKIEDIARREGLSIRVVRHDLTKPLPEDLRDGHDVFVADPTYTLPGVQTFTLRGWEALVKERGRRGYVCLLPDELGSHISRVFRSFGEMGFAVERVVVGLNHYLVARDSPIYWLAEEVAKAMGRPDLADSVAGYSSNLYVLVLTEPRAAEGFRPAQWPIYDYFPTE